MKKYNHMALEDRCQIERYLTFGCSFKEIAKMLNRNPSTIAREIKNHRTFITPKSSSCANYSTCQQRKICGEKYCMKPCKNCEDVNCREVCKAYMPHYCPKLDKAPYVCNNCSNQDFCSRVHAYYHAHKANNQYTSSLSSSRKSLHIDERKAKELDKLISPLIKKGQSISHIFSTHKKEIALSRKTIYNYIDRCVFEARNIDLPRKVRYKKRKAKPSEPYPYKYREGRTYEDFQTFMEQHPELDFVEMDTVKGSREKGKVLLTMIFARYDFMLIFLLDSASQECVQEIFDFLLKALGLTVFRRLFPVILTDNGGEFKNPEALEKTQHGSPCTRIFYCNPMASWQKPHIERNHEFIRCVLPKGKSFDNLSQTDITLLANHINSLTRDSLDSKSPFIAAKDFLGPKTRFVLGLKLIKPDDVFLKPALLNR